jgi:hypothetical protein
VRRIRVLGRDAHGVPPRASRVEHSRMICAKDERVVGIEREVRAASRGFVDVVSK